MAMEHRWGTRYHASAPVLIAYSPDSLISGQLLNISTSGVLVEMRPAPAQHQRVRLHMRFRDYGVTRVIESWAAVVRIAPDGVGMAFDADQAKDLGLLLARLATRDALATRPTLPPTRRERSRP
jgi:hypothetical protein